MIYIISGTDRPESYSRKVSDLVLELYKKQGTQAEIMDLQDWPAGEVTGRYYTGLPEKAQKWVDRLSKASGLHMVVPEYNGSMPGALKAFVDFWKFPETFEHRPVAFVGLGGRFGGLRPVEHLQQVFGYRNAYQLPERLFLMGISRALDEKGQLKDPMLQSLLENQIQAFPKFIQALKDGGLHTLSRPPKDIKS